MKRYMIAELKASLNDLLKKHDIPQHQIQILLDCMLEADMRGVHSHGLSVLPAYITKIKNGGFNLTADSSIIQQTAAFAVVDANNQLGAVSAKKCMDIAIEQCKKTGMYTVFCRNANTFGAAFYYAKMATDNKLIGICLCNSPSAMPAWGGKKKVLGTNPFAVGIPAAAQGPVLIDMATSVVAKSKINEIRKQGGKLPEGWAIDENGEPTTDPVSAIKGMVLPMAAHKGYAIAMAIDILAGVLSGAGYLNNINRFYSDNNECMNVGQCFMVFNPSLILGENFFADMDEYIAELRSSGDNVLYPGEIENNKRSLCNNGSVELTAETAEALNLLFEENNIKGALIEYVG